MNKDTINMINENTMKYEEECLMVASLFVSKTGKKFRRYLEEWLKTPVVSPSESPNFAYFREGSKELIRILFEMERNGNK
ncbi:MAG: hypothetical protein ACTSR1_00275 [Candidatus Heimdallarchaeota archaeon]